MPDAPRHPIHRAADERSLLVGYANTATLYVKDAGGAALDLTGVAVTATVDTEQGRALAAVTAEVADAGAGAVALTIAEAEVAKTEGRDGYLAVRLDLGAGVVYEGQFPVFGEAGFASPAEGSDGYALPDLSLTVTAGEGVDVQAEWLAVRSAATAVATEWEAGASYPAGRIVGYDGQAWRALTATTPGEIPSEASEEWALFVARGEQGETGPEGPQGPAGESISVTVSADEPADPSVGDVWIVP